MLDLVFCNELLAEEGMSFREQCDVISSLGYLGVEIAPGSLGPNPQALSDEIIARMRDVLDDTGLGLTGLHWLLSPYPNLSITDPRCRDDVVGILKELVELCAALGGNLMVHGSPQNRVIQADGYKDGFNAACEVFKPVAEHAASLNVTYCIEPLDPGQTAFINTIQQGVELVDAVGNPAFLTMIDTSSAHFSESKPVADVIREWLPTGMIRHLHFNDSNRGAPGMGDDPFGDIVRAVVESDWTHPVTIEPFRVEVDATTTAEIGFSTIVALQKDQPTA